jgi:hypothetical protein
MSYDLQIYTCCEPNAELARFATEVGFERKDNYFLFHGKSGQVIFHSVGKVEAEDIPVSVFRELPGIGYLVLANIEGAVSVSDRKKAIRLAKTLTRATRGVLVNPQEDTIETACGLKRVDLANAPKEESNLKLSWWFEDADSFEKTGYSRLVEVFESYMPEILPRRYGLWEPPQFKLAEQGREHFLSFFRENLRTGGIVWYSNRPFSYVFVSIPPKVGGSWQGYRSCQIQIQLQSRILQTPGWTVALKRLWLAVAQVVIPFFAEVRESTDLIKSWWWNGIPSALDLAAMIGPPYDKLWPDFVAAGTKVSSDLYYIETIAERKPLPIIAPGEIVQPKMPDLPRTITVTELLAYDKLTAMRYPSVWPFCAPFEKRPIRPLSHETS